MPAIVNVPRYTFLSKPPQNKKKSSQLKPVVPVDILLPLPVDPPAVSSTSHRRRGSLTVTTTLNSWATSIHSGNVPRSPPYPRRGSIDQRRGSTSSSYVHLLEPSENHSSAMSSNSVAPPDSSAKSASKSSTTLKQKRSFGTLKQPQSDPSPPNSSQSKSILQSSNSKPKTKHNLPPTLTNELLLHQFVGGGSLETNMKHMMKKQAKQTARSGGGSSSNAPVSDPYRDGRGGYWRDEDEALEYAPLVASSRQSNEWGTYNPGAAPGRVPTSSYSTGFEDSFVPAPAMAPSAVPPKAEKKKKMDVRNFFGSN